MSILKLYSNLPTLDLHGIDRSYAKILTREFVDDNYKLKEETIIIIHGIGQGIVRKAVHEELKKNRKVKNYKVDNFNSGCSIVTLKKEE